MRKHDPLLVGQYRNASSLNARIQIYRYGTARQSWPEWLLDQFGFPDECRILELGCGTGGLWKANASRIPGGWEFVLSDSSPGMLGEAKKTLSDVGHPFSFQVIDAQSILFPDGSFDAVIANHMLYHVPNRPRALSEVHRVLRSGGRFVASTMGKKHTRELRELVARLAPECAYPRDCDSISDSFGLENGAEQLRPLFASVEMRSREDCLVVPEAKPVVDYILSIDSARAYFEGERLAALVEAIESEIVAAGAMRISQHVGVFLCGVD